MEKWGFCCRRLYQKSLSSASGGTDTHREGVPHPSNVGAVGGGRGVGLAAHLLDVVEGRVAFADLTAEHLLVGLAEVLRQEGVDDGVDG